MPLVSVIVPCYNAERWIYKSLSAILHQSVTDIEVITVNDGSTDKTSAILKEISKEDSRLKVIDKPNGGVSSARNVGLNVARGEWITFVDIDDIIISDGIEKMTDVCSEDTDIIFAGYNVNGEIKYSGKDKQRELSNTEFAKELFKPTDYPYLGYPWAKLFKLSVINNHGIRFDEKVFYNEDRLFTLNYLSHIHKGTYITIPVYNYIQHGDNAMSAINGPSYWKFETDLDAFVEMNKIAPRFNSSEITRLVRLGTITSYHWNRRLNKEFGNNNKATNIRLRKKLLTVVPRRFVYRMTFVRYYNRIKSKLYTFAKMIGYR